MEVKCGVLREKDFGHFEKTKKSYD